MAATITLREHAARMRSVLHLTVKAATVPQAVTVLSYASMHLSYPGNAPTKPGELAACVRLLTAYPWMREPAFEFLSSHHIGAWPLLIPEWDALTQIIGDEIGTARNVDPNVYAPRTFRLMREIVGRQCDKSYCGHSINDHAHTETGQHFGRCTVAGCKCNYFLKGDR
jgi:hypothetical protein